MRVEVLAPASPAGEPKSLKYGPELSPAVELLRCPRCGAPAPPFATACAWCGEPLAPLPPPPPPPTGSSPAPAPGVLVLQAAQQLVIRGPVEFGFREDLQVEDENGLPLARGVRSMEGWVGIMEIVMLDPSGQFLLAFRLAHPPGHPIVQGPIPYLAVDDQGRTVGELRRDFVSLTVRSYELWSQGEPYLTVSSPSRSQPSPLLLRGTPVATLTEARPFLAKPSAGTWTVRFSAPCPHLPVLALATYVAANRGAGTIPLG